MHHGTGRFSDVLQKGMRCFYSHTAVWLRDPPPDLLGLYGVGDPCPTGLYVWENTSHGESGSQMLPWRRWLREECARNGPGYFLVWRRLQGLNPDRHEKLLQLVRDLRHTTYETRKLEMVCALPRLNREEHSESMFCSEMVAYAYKRAGLLSDSVIATNVTTADFSSLYGGRHAVDRSLTGCTLAPDVHVVLPTDLFPDLPGS